MGRATLFILLLIVTFTACEQQSPYPEIVFTRLDDAPVVGRACGSVFVINGKAYVTLGRRGEMMADCSDYTGQVPAAVTEFPQKAAQNDNLPVGVLLKDCHEFDPSTGKWTRKSDFPGEARVFALAAVVGDKAFIGLGYNMGCAYNDSSYLHDFWMYEPVTDSWTPRAAFPGKGVNGASTFVHNHEIYLLHGFEAHQSVKTTWKYNPQSDQWSQVGEFPGLARARAVAVSDGSRFFSGSGFSGRNMTDWWEYFPDTNTWEEKQKMPDKGRVNALAFSVENRFFVGTGRYFAGRYNGGHLKNDVMEYDAANDQWYSRGSIPGEARENAIAFVIDNRVYLGFGENDTETLTDIYSFKP
jgi:N-acetylneuraminic acid mutarotase